MPNTFFASDHHFDHDNILKFTNYDGSPVRTFDSVEHMNEHMIQQHNSVVKPGDTCWFGGDVAIKRLGLRHVARLNGRKRLILGNHDIFKNKDYLNAGFEDLHSFRRFKNAAGGSSFVFTHIPVHSDSLGRWGVNVHGHTHGNCVKLPRGVDAKTGAILYSDKDDPRYFNVSMERLDDYTPIALEDMRGRFK